MGGTVDLTKGGQIPTNIKYRDATGEIKTLDVLKALSINTDKELPLETQATNYFTAAALATEVTKELNNAKSLLEQTRSAFYTKYTLSKELRERNDGKKPTENMLQALVDATPEVTELTNKFNDAKYRAMLLNNLVKAFEQRGDMLRSLSARKRAELNSGQNDVVLHAPDTQSDWNLFNKPNVQI